MIDSPDLSFWYKTDENRGGGINEKKIESRPVPSRPTSSFSAPSRPGTGKSRVPPVSVSY
jgi:hypothetical protein